MCTIHHKKNIICIIRDITVLGNTIETHIHYIITISSSDFIALDNCHIKNEKEKTKDMVFNVIKAIK